MKNFIKNFVIVAMCLIMLGWSGYYCYSVGLAEGHQTGASNAIINLEERMTDIRTGLHGICYEAIENKKGYFARRLRTELIYKVQEYKNRDCSDGAICGYKILWIEGCLAKVRIIENDTYLDIGMVYDASLYFSIEWNRLPNMEVIETHFR